MSDLGAEPLTSLFGGPDGPVNSSVGGWHQRKSERRGLAAGYPWLRSGLTRVARSWATVRSGSDPFIPWWLNLTRLTAECSTSASTWLSASVPTLRSIKPDSWATPSSRSASRGWNRDLARAAAHRERATTPSTGEAAAHGDAAASGRGGAAETVAHGDAVAGGRSGGSWGHCGRSAAAAQTVLASTVASKAVAVPPCHRVDERPGMDGRTAQA